MKIAAPTRHHKTQIYLNKMIFSTILVKTNLISFGYQKCFLNIQQKKMSKTVSSFLVLDVFQQSPTTKTQTLIPQKKKNI